MHYCCYMMTAHAHSSSSLWNGIRRLARPFFSDGDSHDEYDLRRRYEARQNVRYSRFPGTVIDVYLAHRRLTPEIYDVSLPDEVFVRMFEASRQNARSVQKTLHKTYCYKDLVYENFCNDEVRAYRTLVRDVERWEDCVGAAYTREKMPVSSFPCTTSLDNVVYVKTYTLKLHSRTVIVFESMIDRSGRKVNQVHVKGHLGAVGRCPEEEEASRKTAHTVEQVLAKLLDMRDRHRTGALTASISPGSKNDVIVDLRKSAPRRRVIRQPGAGESTCETWD